MTKILSGSTLVKALLMALMLIVGTTTSQSCPCHSAPYRAALLELYNATEGATSWSTKWNISSPVICNWYGISCGLSGNSTSAVNIQLTRNGLTGTIPATLSTIPVEQFTADDNALSGSLFDTFSVWGASLTRFSVNNNSLEGTLPTSFGNWTSMVEFQVSGNSLTGAVPSEYRLWGNVITFNVAYNRLSGTIPVEYEQWTRLENIDLSANIGVTGALPVHSSSNGGQNAAHPIWPKLKSFRILGCQFHGTLPVAYSAWSSMTSFEVSQNALTGALPTEYSQWGGSVLHVSCTENRLSGTIPQAYDHWINLLSIDVTANSLGGALPRRNPATTPTAILWPKLTRFTLSLNAFTGTLPDEYSQWNALHHFQVHSNSFIIGSLPASYGQWGPSLLTFMCFNNSLTGVIPAAAYASWTSLQTFDVARNGIGGVLPDAVLLWPRLLRFSVERNKISGTLPESYAASWSQVNTFLVSFNQLSGTLPASYGDAWKASMVTFVCYMNALSGTLPGSYGLWSASVFQVADNRLTGTLPPDFSNWGSSLLVFSCTNNSLSGAVPQSYATMWTSIVVLELGGNALSGSLPVTAIASSSTWGRLNYFRIDRNRFSGVLPAAYGEQWQTSLFTFEIYQNAFTGTLPPSYGNWSAVDIVRIDSNQLSGTLPPQYCQWGRLKSLNLYNNSLSGVIPTSCAAGWALVTELELSSNQLSGQLPDSPGAWPLLRFLRLQDNQFSGTLPPSLTSSTAVVAFSADNNKLSGTLPAQYSNWGTSLVTFTCTNNSLSGTLPNSYSAWSSLSMFRVEVNRFTGALPHEYGEGWKGMMSFGCYNNSISGSLPGQFMQYWNNLQTIDVSNNLLSGTLPPLSSQQQTTRPVVNAFRIFNNRISGTLPPSYAAWGPSLDAFRFDNNVITGSIPTEYASWSAITYFRGVNNSLSGSLPQQLSNWTSLRYFRVDQNALTGTLPTEFHRWTQIATCIVSRNQLTGTLPAVFGSSWAIISALHLHANSFVGSIPAEWGQMTSLKELFLHVNNLSGELPLSFSKLVRLIFFTIAANPMLNGTLPEIWGTAWSNRGSIVFTALWLQNTSVVGTIPTSWQGSMFSPFGSMLSLCGTHLCGPASTSLLSGIPFVACVPSFLMHEDVNLDTISQFLPSVPLQSLSSALVDTCARLTTAPVPTNETRTPNSFAPSATPPVLNMPRAVLSHTEIAVTAPIGAALASAVGAAPAAFGIFRSSKLVSLLKCGDPMPVPEEVDSSIAPVAIGHLGAFGGSCLLVLGLVVGQTARKQDSHTPMVQQFLATAAKLRLPGRFGVVIFSLCPPMWELGLALLMARGNSVGGGICAVIAAAFLLPICFVLGVRPFRATFVAHSKHAQRTGIQPPTDHSFWRRLSAAFETTRSGEWFHNSEHPQFLLMYGELFEDFTCERQWYVALQVLLALVVGSLAAKVESGTVSGTGCGAIQLAAGAFGMVPFVLLLTLRPHRTASGFFLDVLGEAFGFVGALLVLLVAITEGEETTLTTVSHALLQIQFWLTVTIALLQGAFHLQQTFRRTGPPLSNPSSEDHALNSNHEKRHTPNSARTHTRNSQAITTHSLSPKALHRSISASIQTNLGALIQGICRNQRQIHKQQKNVPEK